MTMRPARPALRGFRSGTRAVAIVLAGLLCPLPSAAQDDLEARVKAAYLFNFARFVTWPAAKLPPGSAPVRLCVLGSAGFADILAETVRGKSISDRPLETRRVTQPEALAGCHVAYVPADAGAPASLLARIAGSHVLTVHEAPTTLRDGVVRFLLEDRKIRFEINVAAAAREDLQLSAKLLGVAYVVQE